jgi:uncharacterized membrane protein YphA (DoxX/SURF4 family)
MTLFDLPNRAGKAVEDWLMEPIDARAYACVRIGYGLLCLFVIMETWPVSDALFSDVGMSWHRPDLLWYLPIKYIQGPGAMKAFMVGSALASLMMTFGLFTRFAAVWLYFWNFSYCAIGYPAEAGYDGIARIVGFIMLWAPTIRTWSLDARIFGAGDPETLDGRAVLPRYALRLMQVQLAIIYVCTVWLKAPDNYWRSGELMSYFQMSMYARIPSWHWAYWGRTSVLMTWGTLIAEATIPFCMFGGKGLRRLGYLQGFGLHGGIALTSTIHMFSLAMVPLYLAFLTTEDIEDVKALIARFRGKKQDALPAPTSATDAKKEPAEKTGESAKPAKSEKAEQPTKGSDGKAGKATAPAKS